MADKQIEISDEDALVLASKGDKDSFGMLYDKYAGRIYNYIYYRTGNQFDAEDLTARVFFRAMKHITRYVDRGIPFSAWLYRIAHNLVANWHRDGARRQEVALEDGVQIDKGEAHPEVAIVRGEEDLALMALIRNLPEERQQLLILKFVEHLSNADIGEIMDRTEGAIKSLYHRTLIALRDDILNGRAKGFSREALTRLQTLDNETKGK
jgi:RNA polymerase sigma-70 factor (ECF subfamily)